jgi:transposase
VLGAHQPTQTRRCRALVRRLIYQDDVLRFATDVRLPFRNAQAEREIRMIRLQEKISAGWRAEHGIDLFLASRFYLSTVNTAATHSTYSATSSPEHR